MKLSISNIAWDRTNEPDVFKVLHEYQVEGIEVAPGMIWPNWVGITARAVEERRDYFLSHGLEVPALQSIFFGKPELQIFNRSSHSALLEHIKWVVEIATGLGAKVIVLGAPKNRKRGPMDWSSAEQMAADLLERMAEICIDSGVCIGLEAVAVQYECDFLTNHADVHQMVKKVNSNGLQLHIDSAAIWMSGGNEYQEILQFGSPAHFHISEKELGDFHSPEVNHKEAYKALQKICYSGWISLEMRKQASELSAIHEALQFVKSTYFPEKNER